MLREIVGLWKKQGVMVKAVDTFGSMLDHCEFLFNRSWGVLSGSLKLENEKKTIHDHDKAINKGEREIRRLLVEHLTLNPGQDVSGCLALMVMSKDAERIGDYAKNIFDLAVLTRGNPRFNRHQSDITTIHDNISKNLSLIKQAFTESDPDIARQILHRYLDIKKNINRILHGLFDEDLPGQDAMSTVLICRYLKRINSHLSNIASGIILPVDKIDFVRGGLLE